MIINFSIQNYKCLKDKVTLSFEPENSNRLEKYYITEPAKGIKLLKLGMLYGANGSGKTTLLEGLDFLRQLAITPRVLKQEQLDFEPFLFDQESRNAPTIFELNFVCTGHRYLYELSVIKEQVIAEKLFYFTPKKALVFARSTDEVKQLTHIKFGSKIKLKKAEEDSLVTNTLWNATVLSGFLKTNIDSVELREVTDWFIDVLSQLITPKTDLFDSISRRLNNNTASKRNILSFMQKADFGITDILVEKKDASIGNELKELLILINEHQKKKGKGVDLKDIDTIDGIDIHFEHSVKQGNDYIQYGLPYADESQGTKRYFQFSGLLHEMLTETKIFIIDELESSLHPDLVKHFLLLFLVNSSRSQLITTTHYRELLMERDMLRDDVIWFTEKKPDGCIDLYSLSDFDSSVVRDTSSVFNAYKSGKLGAVPSLSDYYIDLSHGKNK
ncbi:ATP/GTP-binding protein [Chitinophaga sp. sic0106]|uniref:AAA family ATPase n=1 Tax=Chitinophaga sp. sic0106 TaxID=2854785 RepID=UPI001C46DEC0|nr:ATP-binding protein [Chitinophaga sp. sic0106]MBV7530767.1 ATP-binding protein [Chitinophaga sp. sic0106]